MNIKAIKYKLKPTVKQKNLFNHYLNVTRFIYNLALEYKIELYSYQKSLGLSKEFDAEKIKTLNRIGSEYSIVKELQVISKENDWIKILQSQCRNFVIKRLDTTYKSFFRGGGFPKFASRSRWKSFLFNQGVKKEGSKVFIPKIGWVKCFNHTEIDGKIKQMSIIKEADGWYACLFVECEITPLPQTGESIGIDLGIKKFLYDSNGGFIENPSFLKEYKKKLNRLQRKLAKQKKGSENRKKTVKKLQLLHQKIGRKRKDFLNNQSIKLIRENSTIAMEKLQLKNMTKSAKGDAENHGKMVKQKSGLNRVMLDAGFGDLKRQLEYKAKWHNRNVVLVNPAYTSQTCHLCGHIDKENRKTQSVFECQSCGVKLNADENAAKNILNKGLELIKNNKVGTSKPDPSLRRKKPVESSTSVGSEKQEAKIARTNN